MTGGSCLEELAEGYRPHFRMPVYRRMVNVIITRTRMDGIMYPVFLNFPRRISAGFCRRFYGGLFYFEIVRGSGFLTKPAGLWFFPGLPISPISSRAFSAKAVSFLTMSGCSSATLFFSPMSVFRS